MVRALRSIKKVFLTEKGALQTTAYRGDGGEDTPSSQSAFEMVRALMSIKKFSLTENCALPTTAYRGDGKRSF